MSAHVDSQGWRRSQIVLGVVVLLVLMGISAAIGTALGHRSGDNGDAVSAGAPDSSATTDAPTSTTAARPTTTASTDPPTTASPTTVATAPPTTVATAPPTTLLTPTTRRPTTPAPQTPYHATPPDAHDQQMMVAYGNAFRAECQRIWSHAAADGKLWDADDPASDPHTVNECYDGLDPFFGTSYDDPSQAAANGTLDADSNVQDMTVDGRMRSSDGRIFDLPSPTN